MSADVVEMEVAMLRHEIVQAFMEITYIRAKWGAGGGGNTGWGAFDSLIID